MNWRVGGTSWFSSATAGHFTVRERAGRARVVGGVPDPEFLEIETTRERPKRDRPPGARPRRARGGDQRAGRDSVAQPVCGAADAWAPICCGPSPARPRNCSGPDGRCAPPPGRRRPARRRVVSAGSDDARTISSTATRAPRGSSRTSAPPLARYTRLVDLRRTRERGAVGDVLQVAARGEEPGAVDREPDEQQTEEQHAHQQRRRLTVLVAASRIRSGTGRCGPRGSPPPAP